MSERELEHIVMEVLDRDVRPFVQSHGGDVALDWIRDGHVEVSLVAACRGCGLQAVTFGALIRPCLLEIDGVGSVTCDGIELSPARLDQIAAFAG